MGGLYVAFEWILAILMIELVIFAFVTKAHWQAIGKTALYMAFGLGATFAFFVVAAQVHDAGVSALVFVFILCLSYVVARKLDQI
ncbi:hypothetical protein [Methylocystis hirsuta]|uniref:Uncharacterized protein n=1 Tax=Methylocystis hirsuta TaxID=369798 RepID=A0A3M9XKQ3_9HYPH|nr:hypothetical protein [Methylocystis hirsuta]RNJ48501.1 hypothetical protein D1O30_01515 [Methylocystis hirsuta]